MRKLRRLFPSFASLSVILALAVLSGCAGPPPQTPPTPTSLEGLQQAIQTVLTRDHVPGAGIALVAKNKVIWEGGVGQARLAAGEPVTADTMFRVGPITQTFVALALLKLQEEKKIDLNAKLAELAPTLPFRNRWRSTSPVTVAQVLEHTAGFDTAPVSEAYALNAPAAMKPLDVCVLFPQPLVSRWVPGTRMAESNPGYGVAGYLVWKAADIQFDQYIEDILLEPLGMTDSNFTLTDKIYEKLAQGYSGNSPRPVPYLNLYLRSAEGLKSSPAELAKLVQMFLNGGKVGDQQIVSPESIARMEYPQTTAAARAGLRDGYGLANQSILNGPLVQHGLSASAGGIPGYLSSYGYMPDQGVGYVALINSDSGADALSTIDELLVSYLVAGQTLPPPSKAVVGPAQLEQLTGYYEKENPRNQTTAFLDVLLGGVRVSLSNGQLYLKHWFGTAQPLIPTGNDQFRLNRQAAASTIFFADPSGNEILAQGVGGFYGTRRGEFWPWLRIALLFLGLLAVASSIGFALWWIPRKLMKKMQGVGNLSVRVMPLLASLSLLVAILIAWLTPLWVLGSYNIASVGLDLSSWLFASFSVLGLLVLWKTRWQPVRRPIFWHSLLVSVAGCALTLYMAYWHLLGIRLWTP